jgi:hypothetical protein
MEREPIYAALFERVAGAANFVTKSRRLRHWSEVNPPEQPALFMAQGNEAAAHQAFGTPTTWVLRARLYIYVFSDDPYRAPAEVLNPLIDAAIAALAPPPIGPGGRMVQTLGLPNVVQHCWIEGEIETDEGVLGDQAIAIIPVEIHCVG